MSAGYIWRLTLADDHPLVLRGLKQLIESRAELRVVATATDGLAAEADIRRELPDIAVLDISMPGKNGVDILRSVVRDRLKTRVVLLAASISESMLIEAIRLGAQGLLLKEAEPHVVVECLIQIARGGRWIDPSLAQRADEVARDGPQLFPTDNLTPREVEIMELVAEGCANKIIAERVGISEGTVKIHLHNIYEKTGVANRTALAGVSLRRQPGLR